MNAATATIAADILKQVAHRIHREDMRLRDFIRMAWPIIEPAKPFLENWSIDAISEHLEAVDLGQIKRLVVNVPPRMGKSNVVSVLWPAHSWTMDPMLRWIFVSYSQSLSTKFSVDRRLLMTSDFYRSRWGDLFNLADDQNLKTEYQNDKRGAMVATSVGGTLTGKGGDRIVIDDPVNPQDAESKVTRDAANDFYGRTLVTRLDDPKKGAIVLVMQRLHKDDMTGLVLKEEGWTHLKLPGMAEDRETIIFPVSRTVHTREPGEFMFPERYGATEYERDRVAMGSRARAAQIQQAPSDAEGMIFKREWFPRYRALPKILRSVWFWDTAAKEKEINDFWAGFRVSEGEFGYYVERLVKERMDYPTGKQAVKDEYKARPSTALMIEDKSTGQALIPDLRNDTKLPILAFDPPGDKVLRAHLVSPVCEAKKVYLPEDQPWVADFVENLCSFPDVDHDDDVDAFTGALLYLTNKIGKTPGIWFV